MLSYLPTLTQEQLALLCESGKKGGWTAAEIAENVLAGRWKCFEVGNRGVMAVSVANNVLTVEALWLRGFGWFMREFRNVMDRLATDWSCHTVETMCFDSRLAAAMVKIEAKPVAWLMQWQVHGMEAGDGHEE